MISTDFCKVCYGRTRISIDLTAVCRRKSIQVQKKVGVSFEVLEMGQVEKLVGGLAKRIVVVSVTPSQFDSDAPSCLTL